MKSDDALLLDMLLASREAVEFCTGMSLGQFGEDRRTQLAVMHCIQIIGAARVGEDSRKELTTIPWAQIVGLRHRLVHDYGHIDLGILWEIVRKDLPELVGTLAVVVPGEEELE